MVGGWSRYLILALLRPCKPMKCCLYLRDCFCFTLSTQCWNVVGCIVYWGI